MKYLVCLIVISLTGCDNNVSDSYHRVTILGAGDACCKVENKAHWSDLVCERGIIVEHASNYIIHNDTCENQQ